MSDIIGNIKRMFRGNRKVKDNIHSNGRVLLQLRDDTGMITKKALGENALSKLAKARVVFNGAEILDGGTSNFFGRTHISNDIYRKNVSGGIYIKEFRSNNRQNAVVLLNLTGKTPTDNFIPIYDETGKINRDVVIGWLNSNKVQTGDDYLGVIVDNVKKGLFIGIAREIVGYFDKLKANGTITHAAIMNGIGKPGAGNAEYQGSIAWQNICKSLVNSAWCPPNTPGITGANEIVIFNNTNGVAAYKINLENGEEIKTDIANSAIGWNGTDERGATLLFDTNKLAVIDGTECKILQLNGDGTVTQLFGSSLNISGYNASARGVFIYNGYLYFTIGQKDTSESTSNISKMCKISLSNLSAETQIYNNTSGIIGGLPSGWDINQVNVLAYHNNKFYIRKNGGIAEKQNDIIVCTDLSDISGTICGAVVSELKHFSVISTEHKNDILIGSYLSLDTNSYSSIASGINESREMLNIDASTETKANYEIGGKNLIWMSENYGNWWTLYPLDEPMNKTDADTLDVIYTISWKDI